jgi:hypothetical protein
METIIVILAIGFALSCIPAFVVYLVARRRDSGDRVITCPETRSTEVVRVDAGRAAWSYLRGDKKLKLETCSRWPDRAGCGEECLAEVESAPDGCLVRERLTNWYRGASCARCGMAIATPHLFEHQPGLRSPEGRTLFWDEIAAKDLPGILETHQPVCFDCLIAESFRERFPDRVVDDPWHQVDRQKTRMPGPMA